MPKVLLLADAGSTTGFARVSHSIGDRLVRDFGHEVHCLAVNYDGDAGRWNTPMRLYMPTKLVGSDLYGQSRYVEMLGQVMPDVVLIINDPYVVMKFLFRNKYDPNYLLARTRPILAYMPVDGYNQPPAWQNIASLVDGLEPVKGGTGPRFVPVAMTKFGQDFLTGSEMIYHGVDTDTFRPVSKAAPLALSSGEVITSKAEAKAAFGIPPDAFLVLRVDRNSHRKNFADTWRALQPVMKAHDDVWAWFHCKAQGDQMELPQLFARDMGTAGRFRVPGTFSNKIGWDESDLVGLYNAADVFVSTTWGEGFGLTLAEAAACGVPVIASNVSSIPEVVGPGGRLLKPERLIAVESGQDQWLPDVSKFSYEIEKLYGSEALRQSLGAAGRAHVVSTFSWDEAARQFDELITRVAQEAPEIHTQDGDEDDDAGRSEADQEDDEDAG